MDASEFMVENNVKSETELFAIVDEQKKSGKKDPANVVVSPSTKTLSDLLQNTWKINSAIKKSFSLKTNPHGRDSWAFSWEMCRLL